MKKIRFILGIVLFYWAGSLSAQEDILLTGRIWADDAPEGLVAVTIAEQDKNGRIHSSTLTDFNGNFSLKVKSELNDLFISYVGYKRISLPIKKQRSFDIKMESEMELEEVEVKAVRTVNTGTLPISEREFSGAMQRFSMDQLEGVSIPSVDDALQGRIAGLDIVMKSGDIGRGSVMRVRGITSINSNWNI